MVTHVRTFLQGRFSLSGREAPVGSGWKEPKGRLEVPMVHVDHFIICPPAGLARLPGTASGLGAWHL